MRGMARGSTAAGPLSAGMSCKFAVYRFSSSEAGLLIRPSPQSEAEVDQEPTTEHLA